MRFDLVRESRYLETHGQIGIREIKRRFQSFGLRAIDECQEIYCQLVRRNWWERDGKRCSKEEIRAKVAHRNCTVADLSSTVIQAVIQIFTTLIYKIKFVLYY